jgi:GAF domain-containing protein
MKPEHERALQQIAHALQAAGAPADKLTEVCRILQSLQGYTGVYIYVLEGDTLVLTAFHGRATEHTRIPSGTGVCGASVQTRAPVLVADVASDPRYLACNLETKSEIVFPILRGATYLAQIDVDSDDRAAFGAEDEAFLAQVADRLEPLFAAK